MSDIFFSIIVPTYNSALSIKDSINSIVFQSYRNWEILVMDGLSTDDTINVIQKYDDERIKIFSEKDTGIYDAMNKGIIEAGGRWLFFLGSDDIFFDNEVLTNVHHFITEKSSLDILYGNVFFKNAKIKYYGETGLERLLLENNLCHQSIFYNASVFEKIGNYNLKYPLYADWDLNIRCFMHPNFSINYIDLIISTYNDLDGTSAKNVDTDLNFLNILPRYHIDIQRKKYLNSMEFKIGKKILSPVKFLTKKQ